MRIMDTKNRYMQKICMNQELCIPEKVVYES
jgi:hypothetical protein